MSPAPSLLYTPPPSGLSTMSRVVLAAVVLAVCGGIYYWYVGSRVPVTPAVTSQTSSAPAAGTPPAVGASILGDALLTEAAVIDAQLSGLTADNASMNAPDQPISQSY